MIDETPSMDTNTDTMAPSMEETITRSPRTHVDSSPLPTDSMVTVPLSEAGSGSAEDEQSTSESVSRPDMIVEERITSSRADSCEIHKAFGRRGSQASVEAPSADSPTVSVHDVDEPESLESGISRMDSSSSRKSIPVDWAELEKKEEEEPEGEEEVHVESLHEQSTTLIRPGHGIATCATRARE